MMLRVPGAEGSHAVQNEPVQPIFHEGPARKPECRTRNALNQSCGWTREKQEGAETHGRGTEDC